MREHNLPSKEILGRNIDNGKFNGNILIKSEFLAYP